MAPLSAELTKAEYSFKDFETSLSLFGVKALLPLVFSKDLLASSSSSLTFNSIFLFGISIVIESPSLTSEIFPPAAASGET